MRYHSLHTLLKKAAFAVASISITVVLFALISITQELMSTRTDNTYKETPDTRRIVAEIVKPPEEEEETKKMQRRLRSVQQPSGKKRTRRLPMRFTPDLSVTSTQDAAAGYAAADTGVLVFSQGDVDVAPQKRISPAPEYPFIAQKLEIRGEALAKFVIGVRGTVERIVSIDAPHPSIEREVRETLQQWKFTPAQKDGVPVRCYATQTFSFQQ